MTVPKKAGKPLGTRQGPQEGSLGAKLLNIRVGEMIMVEDEWQEGSKSKPTQMERQVGAICNKSWYLEGRKFETTRCPVIIRQTAIPFLAISRTV